MGRGFTSSGQESGSVFSAAVCKIQASKRCIKSLPLVEKDKRSCFSQVKGPLYSCLLIARLPSLIDIWKPSTCIVKVVVGCSQLGLPQLPPFQSTVLTTNIRAEVRKTNQEAQPNSKGELNRLLCFPEVAGKQSTQAQL